MSHSRLHPLGGLEILYELCSRKWECEWSKTDVIVMALHVSLVNSGYKCLSASENIPESKEDEDPSELLPNGWYANQNCYCFVYKNEFEGNNGKYLIVKCVPLSTKFTINVLSKPDDKVVSLALEVTDFVQDHYNSFKDVFKDKVALGNRLNVDVCSKLLKDISSKSNEKHDIEEPRNNKQPDLQTNDPLRADNYRSNGWEPQGMIGGYRDLQPGGFPHPSSMGGPRYDPVGPFDFRGGGSYSGNNPDHFRPPRFHGGNPYDDFM